MPILRRDGWPLPQWGSAQVEQPSSVWLPCVRVVLLMAEGPETLLTRAMRKEAKERYGHRLVTIKYHGDMMGEAGVSDLLWVLDGVFGATEVKSPKSSKYKRATIEASIKCALDKGPTLKQRVFVARVIQASGCGGFAASIEQFMDQLACAERVATGLHVCTGHHLRPFLETEA